MGQSWTFQVITYDEPGTLLYETPVHDFTIGAGAELGLDSEGRKDNFNLIPLNVDISATRIEIDYRNADPGPFYDARFNGYIFDFGESCPQIVGAKLDPEQTNMAIGNKRLSVDHDRFFVNVSGLEVDRTSRMVIDLVLEDC